MDGSRTPWLRQLSRILLALLMVVTGIGHLTFLRQEFQAQVPRWVPLDTDMVVVLSGIAEVALGMDYWLGSDTACISGLRLPCFSCWCSPEILRNTSTASMRFRWAPMPNGWCACFSSPCSWFGRFGRPVHGRTYAGGRCPT